MPLAKTGGIKQIKTEPKSPSKNATATGNDPGEEVWQRYNTIQEQLAQAKDYTQEPNAERGVTCYRRKMTRVWRWTQPHTKGKEMSLPKWPKFFHFSVLLLEFLKDVFISFLQFIAIRTSWLVSMNRNNVEKHCWGRSQIRYKTSPNTQLFSTEKQQA